MDTIFSTTKNVAVAVGSFSRVFARLKEAKVAVILCLLTIAEPRLQEDDNINYGEADCEYAPIYVIINLISINHQSSSNHI